MLNNTNWDKPKVKPGVHSLTSLIDWLETKDQNQSYHYMSDSKCLLAQYYRAKGYWFVRVGMMFFTHGWFDSVTMLPEHFDFISYEEPHTFGAALDRSRQVLLD
jgi:hypothetical protein